MIPQQHKQGTRQIPVLANKKEQRLGHGFCHDLGLQLVVFIHGREPVAEGGAAGFAQHLQRTIQPALVPGLGFRV